MHDCWALKGGQSDLQSEFLTSFNLNLNSHLWLVATMLDDTALDLKI